MKRTPFPRAVALLLTAALIAALSSGCSGSVSFQSVNLSDGKVGVSYTANVANGSGGKYYEVGEEDILPLGLILQESGEIVGTPREAGTFDFTIFAYNDEDAYASAEFHLTVAKGEITYTGKTLNSVKTNEPCRLDLGGATGIDGISYTVKEGTELPAGLQLDPDTGSLYGVPETAGEATVVVVASAGGCDPVEASYSLTIEQGEGGGDSTLGHLEFEDFEIPDAEVGVPFEFNLRKAYGVPGISYSVSFGGGGLPAGLTYDDVMGTISGTPTDSTDSATVVRITAKADGVDDLRVNKQFNTYDKSVETNRFEAELLNLSKNGGAGYSFSMNGPGMIVSTDGASEGKAISYINKANTFTFTIHASQAGTATLVLGAGTDMGTLTLSPDNLQITANGTELSYSPITVSNSDPGSDQDPYQGACNPYTVGEITLEEGDNEIVLVITKSSKPEGSTGTPQEFVLDYLELQNAPGTLQWRPKVSNVNG